MITRTLLTAAALAALAGCSAGTPAATTAPDTAHVLQLQLPVVPPVDTPDGSAGCGNYCGTDAGMIPPAPAVEQLEAPEATPAVVTPPAPVVPAPAPVAEMPAPEQVQEQLPEESGGRAIDCPDGTVGTQQADGTVDCGVQQ
jgi:hypothetical protein